MALRIMLIDAEAGIRSRVRALLAEDMVNAIIEDVGTAAAGLERLRECECAAVVLDIRIADGSGLDVLRTVHDAFPASRIVVLSTLPMDPYAVVTARLGADAYVEKHRVSDDLTSTLRYVLANGRVR